MADLKEKEFETKATSKLPGIYLPSGCTARACWNQSRHGENWLGGSCAFLLPWTVLFV
jgi:hypothetical protein